MGSIVLVAILIPDQPPSCFLDMSLLQYQKQHSKLKKGAPHIPGSSENICFLGPRGPLRLPLISIVPFPQQFFPFPHSDSKLTQPLPQYTVHRTLNRIISRTFQAQFGLVSMPSSPLSLGSSLSLSWCLFPYISIVDLAPPERGVERIFFQWFLEILLGMNKH